jgi:hypothetical protein
MFGYADPAIKYLIEQLAGAQNCAGYNMRWPTEAAAAAAAAAAARAGGEQQQQGSDGGSGGATPAWRTPSSHDSKSSAGSRSRNASSTSADAQHQLTATEILVPAAISLRAMFNLNLSTAI